MSVKDPIYYSDGRLQGSNLSDQDCYRLETLRRLYENGEGIPEFKHLLYDLDETQVETILDTQEVPQGMDMARGTLLDFQTSGLAFMYYAKSCVLGDSGGLGKTAQVSALINLVSTKHKKEGKPFRFLFLSEKTPSQKMQAELVRFTGSFVDHTWGDQKSLEEFTTRFNNNLDTIPSFVAPHSVLNHPIFQDFMLGYQSSQHSNMFDLIIIDESSILGNTANKNYKNAQKLFKGVERIIMLNATPFESKLDVFYAQINLIDDTLLPRKTYFDKQFKIYDWTGLYPMFKGKYKNADIFRKMVEFRYLARTRVGLGAEIKDCTAEVIKVPLSPEQKHLLKRVSLPQQVYDCPWELDSSFGTCGKIEKVIDMLTGDLSDVQVLVYVHYKSAQEKLLDRLNDYDISAATLNGDTDSEDRAEIINMFQNNDIRVLITNVQKSLNFGDCDHCIFYNYDPNPNKMVQFEWRMTRCFDIVGKHVYVIMTEGKELDRFNTVIRDRALASVEFAGADFSIVLTLLEDELSE